MMNQPTPITKLLQWHRDALAGLRPNRYEDEPECGWYKRRMVKDGPWIPVKIWMDQLIDAEADELSQPEEMRCTVLHNAYDPVKTWTFCRPISQQDYEALMHIHEVEVMMAATHTPIDLSHSPIGPPIRS